MIGRWIFVREQGLVRRDWLVLAGLFALGLVVLLPLRLVFGQGMPEAVSARSVEGSVWAGRIADLRVGPVLLGTLDAGLLPLPLLLGQAEFALTRSDGAPFAARVSTSDGSARISRASGTIALPDGLGGLPVTSLGLSDFGLQMESARCTSAQGTVSMTLASPGPLMPEALALSGTARCVRGALVIPMQGAGGMEKLNLRLDGDGSWRADLVLSGLPRETSEPLLAGGFTARPDGIGIRTSGRF